MRNQTQEQQSAASLARSVAETHYLIDRALVEASFMQLRGKSCPELLTSAMDLKVALELLSKERP